MNDFRLAGTSSVANSLANIYTTKFLAMATNFATTLVAIPYLTDNESAFAVYSICISLNFIMAYGDFGFVAASQKFASESYGRGSEVDEAIYLGVIARILIVVGLIFSAITTFLYFSPTLALRNLTPNDYDLASKLFLILALTSPLNFVLQRLLTIYLISRLEDYKLTRVEVFGNIIKISMVSFFDSENGFEIEKYFLVCQLISIITVAFVANRYLRQHALFYKMWSFDRVAFANLIPLAKASFFSTLCFILFYEADILIAGQFFSPTNVAHYALAITLMNLLRSLCNVIYGPMLPVMNRLLGESRGADVRQVALHGGAAGATALCCLFIFVAMFSWLFLQLWVGEGYRPTSALVYYLALGSTATGLSLVASFYSISHEDRASIVTQGLIPLVIFASLLAYFIFFRDFNIASLAFAKSVAIFSLGIYSLVYLAVKLGRCFLQFSLVPLVGILVFYFFSLLQGHYCPISCSLDFLRLLLLAFVVLGFSLSLGGVVFLASRNRTLS